ncbi:hypothetical protein LWC34_29315 [Kibdelosporangium philippinense]|uniref:Bulb-type lectin domain-containing protein n=2 Tax=Kibdelosporangium philippinense TaxID=211113 RepID=A0ABS8ZJT7_9PSEU|nr:hypothetical protein [Kibdelosporangium philippinense]MCE7006896.1 hypothetical protein [Kibdelosporangium philippinense]
MYEARTGGGTTGVNLRIANATANAPSVARLRFGFVIVYRGFDSRIYYMVNPNSGGNGIFTWTRPRAIPDFDGRPISTSATPVISEINGRVTVAYRNAGNNPVLSTIDGTLDTSTFAITWSNGQNTGAESPSSPALTNFAGTEVLVYRRSGPNRLYWATRNGNGPWSGSQMIPGSPVVIGRPSVVAAGNQMDAVALRADPAQNDGRTITRTRFTGGPGWSGQFDNDPQNWRTFSAPVVYAIGIAILIFIRGANNVVYGKNLSG